MISSLLQDTLSTIAIEQERDGKFNQSFDLAKKLIKTYSEKDLAQRLYDEISPECPWKVIADLFGILIWSMSDDGATEFDGVSYSYRL